VDNVTLTTDLLTPCSCYDSGAVRMGWQDVPPEKLHEPVLTKVGGWRVEEAHF